MFNFLRQNKFFIGSNYFFACSGFVLWASESESCLTSQFLKWKRQIISLKKFSSSRCDATLEGMMKKLESHLRLSTQRPTPKLFFLNQASPFRLYKIYRQSLPLQFFTPFLSPGKHPSTGIFNMLSTHSGREATMSDERKMKTKDLCWEHFPLGTLECRLIVMTECSLQGNVFKIRSEMMWKIEISQKWKPFSLRELSTKQIIIEISLLLNDAVSHGREWRRRFPRDSRVEIKRKFKLWAWRSYVHRKLFWINDLPVR